MRKSIFISAFVGTAVKGQRFYSVAYCVMSVKPLLAIKEKITSE